MPKEFTLFCSFLIKEKTMEEIQEKIKQKEKLPEYR